MLLHISCVTLKLHSKKIILNILERERKVYNRSISRRFFIILVGTDFYLEHYLHFFVHFYKILRKFIIRFYRCISLFRYVFLALISLPDSSSRQCSISCSFPLVSPRSPFVLLAEASSRCFFFRSKSGRARRRLGSTESDSSEVPACEQTESRGRLSWFGLIRRSARCPASIRNPFVGPDLFFQWILSKGCHRRADRSFRIVRRKKSFFKNNRVVLFKHHP